MKTLLLLLLFMGAFLVMDGAHRESTKEAVRLAEARAAGRKRYVVADEADLLDLQFSQRAMQHGSLFDSSGPWAFMDDVGTRIAPPRSVFDNRARLMRSRVPAGRSAAEAELRTSAGADKPPGPGAPSPIPPDMSRQDPGAGVGGFSGAAGGIPTFLDGFGEAPGPARYPPGPAWKPAADAAGKARARAPQARANAPQAPGKCAASPGKCAASPRRCAASPGKCAASPRRRS